MQLFEGDFMEGGVILIEIRYSTLTYYLKRANWI